MISIGRTPIARIVLIAFSALVLFANFHSTALPANDVALHTGIARHMAETGRFGTPELYGRPWFEHLPPFLWITAASFDVFGFNPGAARLPFLLIGLVTVLAVFEIGRTRIGDFGGFVAGVVLTTTEPFWRYAGRVRPDILLTCGVTLAILCLERVRAIDPKERLPWWIGFGLSTGLAFFSKGPMALTALFALAAAIALDRRLVDRRMLAGLSAMILVPAPWIIYQFASNGSAWFDRYVLHQVLWLPLHDRSSPHSVWMVPRVLFRIYWPWAPILILGLVRIARGGRAALDRFGVIVAAALFVCLVLTISVRQTEYYLLPAYPMFALIAAGEIAARVKSEAWEARVEAAVLVLSCAFAIALLVTPLNLRRGSLERETERLEAIAPMIARAIDGRGSVLGIYGFQKDRVIWTLSLDIDLESPPVYFDDPFEASRFLADTNHVLLVERGRLADVERGAEVSPHEIAGTDKLVLLQGAPSSR